MSFFSDLVERARSLVFRNREERELDEELRTHMEMEAEYRRRSGHSAGDAQRESAIAFGGLERVKDDVRDARGTRFIEQTTSDVAFGIRTLLANPGFTFVTLATLAVGIGGTTAVFSAVDAVLLQPLPYAQPGQLVRLFQQDSASPNQRGFVTPVHFVEVRRRMSSFASVATINTYSESGADIGSGDGVRRIKLLQTSADYFDVLRVRPEIGRGFQKEDEIGAPVVVISHALWKEALNGDRSAVGRTLTMNGVPYTVAGVMPDGFDDPLVRAVDAWVPIDLRPAQDPGNAGNHYLAIVARLRGDVSIERAQSELNDVARGIARDFPATSTPRVRMFPLQEEIVRSSSRALEIMLGAVVLVLVLVCVNVANLLLVRGSERAQEFAVRAALGAERSRLVRQMLIESLVLAIAGALAGLLVARLAMSAIVALGAGTIPRLATLTLDGRLLAFSLVVATASAALFGIAPAFRVARTQPGDVLRGQTRSSTGSAARVRVREWLVVSQVALAFVLLIGAGLLLSSFQRIQQVPLGVKSDGVFTFELHLPEARYDSAARGRFYEQVAERIAQIPGVRAAGGVSRLPSTGRYNTWGTRARSGPLAGVQRPSAQAEHRIISGDYFRAVGIPVLKGRNFDGRDDFGAPSVVLITKSLADALFPGVDPIGQTLRGGGQESQVIGIVGEVAVDNEGHQAPYVYHAHRQWAADRNWALTQVVALENPRAEVQSLVRGAITTLDPQLVVHHPAMLDDAIGGGAAQRLFTLRILLAFAAVAIVLAALGIFGVLSYGVRLRAREFSIRMALGAQRGAVRQMVLRRGLVVTGIGIGIGVLSAAFLSRLMMSVLFEVSPLDPIVYAGAVVFMAIVAVVSAYVPAHRATVMDPRTALQ
jgi:predicted permease